MYTCIIVSSQQFNSESPPPPCYLKRKYQITPQYICLLFCISVTAVLQTKHGLRVGGLGFHSAGYGQYCLLGPDREQGDGSSFETPVNVD
jgi:hypothetical protein